MREINARTDIGGSRWSVPGLLDLLRDLDDAAQVYPDAVWPVQIADALRGLTHHAHLAREQNLPTIDADTRDELLTRLRNGMLAGLSVTTSTGTRPGERKARLLLEVLRDPPPPTRPNATYAPARSNRKYPGD